MASGRKTIREEATILKRYSDLTEPYFRVLKAHLESKKKEDQRWAADNLKSAFAKMIPQKIQGDGEDGELVFKVISYSAIGNHPTSQLPAATISASAITGD